MKKIQVKLIWFIYLYFIFNLIFLASNFIPLNLLNDTVEKSAKVDIVSLNDQTGLKIDLNTNTPKIDDNAKGYIIKSKKYK